MPRRVLKSAGAIVAALGFAVAVASLAVPWATYHVRGTALGDTPVSDSGSVAVLAVPGGSLYVLAVLLLVGAVALAAFGPPATARIALTVAPILGAATLILTGWLANGIGAAAAQVLAKGFAQLAVTGEAAAGVVLGLLAGPLLAAGAYLIGLTRRDSLVGAEPES
jgi:hypothetical protein